MPRNSSGVFSLVSGNPVVTNTKITSTWANNTLSDVANELTNSLDRNGRGKMAVPFLMLDGSGTTPAYAFTNETNTGFWRSAAGRLAVTVLGTKVFEFSNAGVEGTIQFNGTVSGVTATAGDSTTKFATTAFVQGVAMTAALPNQTGNSGKFVTTDGTNASWTDLGLAIEKQDYTYLTTGGAGGAFTLTPTRPLVAYTAGASFDVNFHQQASGTSTINISGLGAIGLVRQNNDGSFSAIASGEFQAGHRSRVVILPGATQALVVTMPPLLTQISNISYRNKVRNGEMLIAQRGGGVFNSGTIGTGAYTLDGWRTTFVTSGAFSLQQSTDVPHNEFQACLKLTVTAADAAVAAGDFVSINQPIEGYLVRDFLGGNLIGNVPYLSFWVKSSKTGTHCVAIVNGGADRSFVATYTVSAANTWEFKRVALAQFITAGTWNWTNGTGCYLHFMAMCGSTFQTTANAWQAGNFYGTAAQVNVMDTLANVFAITGVQLEKGLYPTNYEHLDPVTELQRCQRYYLSTQAFAAAYHTGYSIDASGQITPLMPFPVTMRSTPTASNGTANNTNVASISVNCGPVGYSIQSSTSVAGWFRIQITNLTFSAELT